MIFGFFILIKICLVFPQTYSVSQLSAHSVFPELKVIVGSIAHLPCNITAPAHDSIQLILWYKSSNCTGPPFYTIDARNVASLEHSKHFKLDSYKHRISINTTVQTAALIIDSAQDEDSGEYSCRVDFKWSRTSISVAKLFVVVPPQDVIVIDVEKSSRLQSVAGPYKEGTDLKLKCIAIGGKPLPSLLWFFDNQMIDDSYTLNNSSGNCENELILKYLKRDFLDSVLSCKADNYHSLPPISASLRLSIYLKPSLVSIMAKDEPLRADKKVNITCVAKGSSPPANITWILQNIRLKDIKTSHSLDGMVTTSTLFLVPSYQHHGSVLFCVADNSQLISSAINDSWTLNVLFKPVIRLRLEGKHSYVIEGRPATLRCEILANPAVSEIQWLYENELVNNHTMKGVVISNESLYINSAQQSHKGTYECISTNTEGRSKSKPYLLDIYYPPKCTLVETLVYELSSGQVVNLTCSMSGFPKEMTYKWEFEGGHGYSSDNGMDRLSNRDSKSIWYKVVDSTSYRTLLCGATNQAGTAKELCRYEIRPSKAKPKPPANCQLVKNTFSYQINCHSSHKPLGQNETFYLEIYDSQRTILLFRSKQVLEPMFKVSELDLTKNETYLFVIYAQDKNGRSTEVVITTETQKMMSSRAEHPVTFPTKPPVNWSLYSLVGSFGVFFLLVLITACSIQCFIKHLREPSGLPEHVPGPGKLVSEQLSSQDSKTPDVIPLSIEGLEEFLPLSCSTEKNQGPDPVGFPKEIDFSSISNLSDINIFNRSKISRESSTERRISTSFGPNFLESSPKHSTHVFMADEFHEAVDRSVSISTPV